MRWAVVVVVVCVEVCRAFVLAPALRASSLQHKSRRRDERSGLQHKVRRRRDEWCPLFAAEEEDRRSAANNASHHHRKPNAKPHRGKPRRKNAATDRPSPRMIAINRDISRNAETADEILRIFKSNRDDFVAANYATALTWVAKKLNQRRVYEGPPPLETRREMEALAVAAARDVTSVETRRLWRGRPLANAAWGAAKLHREAVEDDALRIALTECVDAVATRSMDVLGGEGEPFKPQELSNVAWSLATAGVNRDELLTAVAKEAKTVADTFRPQEVSNLLWSFAKYLGPRLTSNDETDSPSEQRLVAESRALFEALIEFSRRRGMAHFKPQELANMVWAVATVGYVVDERWWDAAAEAFEAKQLRDMDNWRHRRGARHVVPNNDNRRTTSEDDDDNPLLYRAQPQNVANFLWATAKALPNSCSDVILRRVFDASARWTKTTRDRFKPQESGNVVWAFATAKIECDELFDFVASEPTPLQEFSPQNLANVLWSFATIGRGATETDKRFFQAVGREAATRMDAFKPQEVANIVWAFATAGVTPPRVFVDAAIESASKRIDKFANQGLSNLIWSLSTLDVAARHQDFFALAATETASRVPELPAQAIANILWAYANAELVADDLFAAVARDVVDRGGRHKAVLFNAQEFANVIFAFAKNAFDDEALAGALYETLGTGVLAHAARSRDSRHNDRFSEQEIANLLWAYACADHVDPSLTSVLWTEVNERAKRARHKWRDDDSGAILSHQPDSSSRDSSQQNTREFPDKVATRWGFSGEELRQLQQVVLHARYEATGGRAAIISDMARAPPEFLADLREALRDYDPRRSRAQGQVASAVAAMGIDVCEEHVTPDGLSIDVALSPTSRRVGIEFDGPAHFFKNQPRRPTGRTLFKQRLLKATGWRVLHIPYWDWTDRSPADRAEYVRQGLIDLLTQTSKKRKVGPMAGGDASSAQQEHTSQQPRRRQRRQPRTPSPAVVGLEEEEEEEEEDTRDEYSSLSVAELRLLCAKRGLDKTVKRTEGDARTVLERRLREQAAAELQISEQEVDSSM